MASNEPSHAASVNISMAGRTVFNCSQGYRLKKGQTLSLYWSLLLYNSLVHLQGINKEIR